MLQKAADHGSLSKVYGCEVRRRHYLERADGGGKQRFQEQILILLSIRIEKFKLNSQR